MRTPRERLRARPGGAGGGVDVGEAVRAALATAGGAERAAGAPDAEPGELVAQAAATLAGWLAAAPEPAAAAWAAAHKARRPRRAPRTCAVLWRSTDPSPACLAVRAR